MPSPKIQLLRARSSRTETFISTPGLLLTGRLLTRLITYDYYLVVAKVRERLAVRKQAAQKSDGVRFNLRMLSDLEVRKQYQIEITNRFAALENVRTRT